MSNTLVITNDFPPRPGGIQTFCYELVRRFEPEQVSVLTSNWDGAVEFDAAQKFTTVRAKTKTLLPDKRTLAMAREIVVANDVTRVVFGAAAPLGLLASSLRKLGVTKIVGITQGHETGWAMTPGLKQALRKIGNDVDHLTYLNEYTHTKISRALSPHAIQAMRQILPGVNSQEFTPTNSIAGLVLRSNIGWANRPVIVCVSRLMTRKGQDKLIQALPSVHKSVPFASLIIVGDGPYRKHLEKLTDDLGLRDNVHFTGKVDQDQLANWYAAGDVFAMPCRTRVGGWDVEGLGIVFLEASATGLPVVVGDSGGAVDALLDGVTGFLVNGNNVSEISDRLSQLLSDQELARRMGAAGRSWVMQEWTWEHSFKRLDSLLSGVDVDQ